MGGSGSIVRSMGRQLPTSLCPRWADNCQHWAGTGSAMAEGAARQDLWAALVSLPSQETCSEMSEARQGVI